MKKVFLFLFCLSCCYANAQKSIAAIIPFPKEMKIDTGFFNVNKETVLVDSLNEFPSELSVFNSQLQKLLGYTLPISAHKPEHNYINVFHGHEGNRNTFSESYVLRVARKDIELTGLPEGVFHGLQTLVQLIGVHTSVPALYINDQPAFSWRGMHLDVCRHFFTKEEVMRYLDELALYKFNVFHWHLTDDQGWRIEIKQFPKLTGIGSVRKETVIGKPSDTARYDGKPYGGFYTQEDIKEVVAYAAARHITVIPEIEMPGHAQAALAAYPQYSCTGGPFPVATTWGAFDEVYCPKDSTFVFLEKILDEVMVLFPAPYIHIGGDECSRKRWQTCTDCQALMKKEHLKDENELQSYFIRRIEKYLNSKGKQIIGWDEILEGGLAPNATVMSWRGIKGGIKAMELKHQVIMTPGKPCYFDHYQSKDKKNEPLAIGGYNPLDAVYAFEPIPVLPAAQQATARQYIIGAQGNVWTEYITSFPQVEYMSVPRMCALSEALWTPQKNKSYAGFVKRLKQHTILLDKMQVHYANVFLHPSTTP
ncbi:MAG TPA: beta-N-acetylhexosaminidase [Bacteroidia bacterium]|jgi:hexosaminidase|nr:beta-N-acetylhexosaminidase [Bacteroidia bacterium]